MSYLRQNIYGITSWIRYNLLKHFHPRPSWTRSVLNTVTYPRFSRARAVENSRRKRDIVSDFHELFTISARIREERSLKLLLSNTVSRTSYFSDAESLTLLSNSRSVDKEDFNDLFSQPPAASG